MASKYLDLYTSEGGFYGGFQGNSKIEKNIWGVQRGTYRPGQTERVVQDTLNNKYYGTQTQSDLVKGLEDAIKRKQGNLASGGETRYYKAGIMHPVTAHNYRYSTQDIKDQKAIIKQQQQYLKHIMSGGYIQEGKDFFKSYDEYTPGWNNVFTSRYNNKVMTERNNIQLEKNRQQEARNKQIDARNKKVEGRNTFYQRGIETGLDIGNGSKATRKPTQPNKNVSTGIQSQADKLVQTLGIGRSGLGI